eukprot:510761-Pelagomonas_calceolata.AAC.6
MCLRPVQELKDPRLSVENQTVPCLREHYLAHSCKLVTCCYPGCFVVSILLPELAFCNPRALVSE